MSKKLQQLNLRRCCDPEFCLPSMYAQEHSILAGLDHDEADLTCQAYHLQTR